MENYDWTKFTLRIPVKADAQAIYDAWTTTAGLEKWFLRKAIFKLPDSKLREKNSPIQKEDTYEWNWHGYGDDVVEHGKILEANGKDFLQFIFGKAGMVSVNIKKEGGETIAELVQENIPIDETSKVNYHLGCSTGWTFYLANLKSILEGGIDLRNKNEKIKRVVSS